MRIIKVAYFLPTSNMYGDNIALLKIMPILMENGVEPLFICKNNSDISHVLCEHGYRYVEFRDMMVSFRPALKLVSVLRFIKHKVQNSLLPKWYSDLYDELKAFSPDIIHSNNTGALLGFKIAKKLGVKHIWHVREYGDLDANKHYFPCKIIFVKNKLKSKNNYCICITQGVKSHFGLTDNAEVIYDGPIDSRQPAPLIKDKQSYLLFVGRVEPVKGVHIIISAFSRFLSVFPSYKLYIAGDSSNNTYKQELHNLVKEKGLVDNVVFLGYRNDVQSLMQNATSLIVASQFEAFGFISAEAVYNGCPLIGKNTAGTKEQMDNLEKNVSQKSFVRFVDEGSLVQAMIAMCEKPVNKDVLKESQYCIEHLYSNIKSANRVVNFYKKLLYNISI